MEDRLRKFAKVVEAGSFTKAAAALHISQPALTTAVRKLERELKSELLLRSGHAFTVTPAGQAAYQTAKELAAHTRSLNQRIAELGNEKISLHLGMIDSVADLLFVHDDKLPSLEQRAHLSLTVDNSSRLMHYTEQGRLDVAFIAQPAAVSGNLTLTPVGDEPLVLVAHPDYANTVETDLSHGQLNRFVSYDQGSQTYRLIAQHLAKAGIYPQPSFYSTSPEIMVQLLISQPAVAVLPYLLVKARVESGQLIMVASKGIGGVARTIVSIQRKGRDIPAPVKTMAEHIHGRLRLLASEIDQMPENKRAY
jgi:DNA-binding transcriptional LysR family regulator